MRLANEAVIKSGQDYVSLRFASGYVCEGHPVSYVPTRLTCIYDLLHVQK